MPKTTTATKSTTAKAEIKLPKVEINKVLIKQVIESYSANKRQANGMVKTRGMVRGGGKKPWKQKGTGKARAGSSRSPIWVGGGVTFGPTADRNFGKTITTKVKNSVALQVLNILNEAKQISVIDKLNLTDHKTKSAINFLKENDATDKKTLIVTENVNTEAALGFGNIPFATIKPVGEVSAFDFFYIKHLIIEKSAYEILIKRYGDTK